MEAKSGAAANDGYRSKWTFFDVIDAFLRPTVSSKSTKSNLVSYQSRPSIANEPVHLCRSIDKTLLVLLLRSVDSAFHLGVREERALVGHYSARSRERNCQPHLCREILEGCTSSVT